ncbi:MAG: hypothetical protein ACKVT0_04540 [Planctomycetaceae bacterium]
MKAPKGSASAKKPSGASPQGGPATTRSPAPSKRAGSAEAASTAADAAEKPGSDDPFAFDTATIKGVIPLLPRPQKGRSHQVVCPMCETPGFSSTRAVGRQVKCANANCMVPVFTAPALETPVEAPVPPPPVGKAQRYLGMAAVSAVIIAVGVWLSVREAPRQVRKQSGTLPIPGATKEQLMGTKVNPLDEIKQSNTKNIDWEKLTIDEIRGQALAATIEAARQKNDNRSPALCRRLAAEAFILAGGANEAREQFQLLEQEGKSIPYYLIPPLVEQTWRHLAENKREEAEKTAEAAFNASDKLPKRGRTSEIITSQLAAALVATGKIDAAQTLLKSLPIESESNALSLLTRLSLGTREFDLDRLSRQRPLMPLKSANAVIITAILAGHDRSAAAESWIRAQTDPVARMECLAQWGEQQVRASNDTEETATQLAALTEESAVHGKAYIWSRLAQQYVRSGNKDRAKEYIERTLTELSQLPDAPPMVLKQTRDIHDLSSIQIPPEMMLVARAWSELAFANALLGDNAASWKAMQQSLMVCRAMAPSPTAMQNRLQEAEGIGAKTIQAELKEVLELKSDDQARLAFNRYRRNLDQLAELAAERFQIQVQILSRAAEWSLGNNIVEEILSRASMSDEHAHEPYLQSRVPHWILFFAIGRGETDPFPQLSAAMTQAGVELDPRVHLTTETLRGVLSGDYDAVNGLLGSTDVEPEAVYQWVLELPSQLSHEQKWEQGFKFLMNQKDLAAREEGLYYLSALAGQQGEARTLWKLIRTERLAPTETAHASLGLITGIKTAEK